MNVCHSRAGGNPFSIYTHTFNSEMDPRLRGDDKLLFNLFI